MTVYLDEITVGMTASTGKTITEADILLYSAVSTDTNPTHLDAAFAAAGPFKERVAHGMLSAGLISAVLGTRLPGPGTIYLGQALQFRRPVKIGDTVTATAVVIDVNFDKQRATLRTVCTVGDKTVIEGEATVLVPTRG